MSFDKCFLSGCMNVPIDTESGHDVKMKTFVPLLRNNINWQKIFYNLLNTYRFVIKYECEHD